ncbi:hypothetical protein GCM10023190_14270 [Enteractinococcus fodinae]
MIVLIGGTMHALYISELAGHINLPNSATSRSVRGKATPQPPRIRMMERVLATPADQLLISSAK